VGFEEIFYMIFIVVYGFTKLFWLQIIVVVLLVVLSILLIKNIICKNERLIKVLILLVVTIVLLTVSFYIIFPTNFPYVDLWIYGKTSEEIQVVYGAPDYDGHGIICYAAGPHFWDTNYYCIQFENGKAVEIYETTTPWPGG